MVKITENCNVSACKVTDLIVSKDGRPYILAPYYAKPHPDANNPGNRYQVLSSWEKGEAAVVKLAMQTTCPCEGAQPSLQVVGPQGWIDTFSSTSTSYTAPCPKPPKELEESKLPFLFFVKEVLFPWKAKAAEYDVSTHCCAAHRTLRAHIEAFPRVRWKGKLNIRLGPRSSPPKGKKEQTDCRPDVKVSYVDNGAISGEDLMVQYGNREYHLAFDPVNLASQAIQELIPWSSSVDLDALIGFFALALNKASFIWQVYQYANAGLPDVAPPNPLSLVEFKMNRWPQLAVSGEVKNIELPDRYQVGVEGKIKLEVVAFDFSVSMDIFELLAAWICPALATLKEKAAAGAGGEGFKVKTVLEAVLSGNVKLSGGAEVTLSPDNPTLAQGSLSAFGGLSLTGRAHAEGKVFEVYAAGMGVKGLLASAQESTTPSGFKGSVLIKPPKTKGNLVDFGGRIEFNGLAFYYAVYTYVTVRDAKTLDQDKSKQAGRGDSNTEKNKTEQMENAEVRQVATLWEPYTWPEQNTAAPAQKQASPRRSAVEGG